MPIFKNLVAITLLTLTITRADAWSIFSPSDFEECMARAAKEAKSNDGLNILLAKCGADFPARRSPAGGYQYYDPVSRQNIQVSDPKLSAADRQKISIHQDAYRRQAAQAEAAQVSRNQEARAGLSVINWSIDCGSKYSCLEKIITASIKNSSKQHISGIGVGVVVGRQIGDCGSLRQTNFSKINVAPGQIATINLSTYDGPTDRPIQACFGITSVVTQ
jgi:hypothetical protein